MATARDDDGFQVVKRKGRHSVAPKAPMHARAPLNQRTTTSLSADNIIARVEQYK